MRFASPIADPGAPLARRNPVAKLAASGVFTLALLATLDPVAPAIALVLELIAVPLFGVAYGALLRRAWPVLLSALGVVLTLVVFAAERTGAVVLTLGPLVVTTGVLESALGLALRLVAVALPGVLVFATTDPTDLADALVQHLKAPPRFAI
ncbi:MAG TPA: energy-coupling factor transporter transmembrane component T, partial [Pseudonocardiaceae bacterium]|nr:energy-coupling factor transporter transmembrane component T [Pseudonocardiaceae bacterium]